MKKKLIIIIALFLLLIFVIFIVFFLKKNTNVITTYGNIEIRQVDLSFQVDGVIQDVFVEEGDYVKKGDLIAVLDNKDYEANYNKAFWQEKTSLSQANENISKYERNLPLCADGTISKEECTTLKNNKDYAIAKLELDKSNKVFQKNQFDYTKLFAPQDGIITTRVQEKGARVSRGQIVYVLSLKKPTWVRTYIKETDLGLIKYGQEALIETDSIDNKTKNKKTYLGKIGYISPVAEFTPKTVQSEDLRVDLSYRIRIYIDEVDDYLRQGMPVTVKISKEAK